MKVIKTLLAIEVYELTGDEIGKLRSKCEAKDSVFDILPEYCISDLGRICKSSNYLYWIESGEEKYTLFNYSTADRLLDTEIGQLGFEEFMIDIKDFNEHIKDFRRFSYDDIERLITHSEYLIVNLIYDSWDTPDGREYTVDMELGNKLIIN